MVAGNPPVGGTALANARSRSRREGCLQREPRDIAAEYPETILFRAFDTQLAHDLSDRERRVQRFRVRFTRQPADAGCERQIPAQLRDAGRRGRRRPTSSRRGSACGTFSSNLKKGTGPTCNWN